MMEYVRRIMLECPPERAAEMAREIVNAVANNLARTLAPERCADAIHAARECMPYLDAFIAEVERVTMPAPRAETRSET